MKKFLLTALLIAAVVTSLTAGSLAAYTTRIPIESAALTAKTFVISATQGGAFTKENVKVAPGDTAWYKITVKNEGEVDALFDVNATLNGTLNAALKLDICDKDRKPIEGVSNQLLKANGTYTFFVKVYWPYSVSAEANAIDNRMKGKTGNLSVLINSKSANMETSIG